MRKQRCWQCFYRNAWMGKPIMQYPAADMHATLLESISVCSNFLPNKFVHQLKNGPDLVRVKLHQFTVSRGQDLSVIPAPRMIISLPRDARQHGSDVRQDLGQWSGLNVGIISSPPTSDAFQLFRLPKFRFVERWSVITTGAFWNTSHNYNITYT